MSTTITLPKKAKKETVIAALVERARIKHQEETSRLKAVHEEKRKALHDAVREHLAQRIHNAPFDHVAVYTGSIDVHISLDHVPPHIETLGKELRMVPLLRSFNEAQVRKDVRAHLAGHSPVVLSVKAMLEDTETVQNLDKILEEMA